MKFSVRHIDSLEEFLSQGKDSLTLRGEDSYVDSRVQESSADAAFSSWLSEARLVKDEFEIAEMQKAIDATHRGFEDMIRAIPGSVGKKARRTTC